MNVKLTISKLQTQNIFNFDTDITENIDNLSSLSKVSQMYWLI